MMDTSSLDLPVVVVIENKNRENGVLKVLRSRGYNVVAYADCNAAISSDNSNLSVGAVLVSAELGLDTNKVNVIPTLKGKWPFAPLIATVDLYEAEVASEVLASGASDYLVLPIDPDVLAERLDTRILEFHKRNIKDTFALGDIRVDAEHRIISKRDKKCSLSPTEMSLLQCLAVAKGTIVNRDVMKRRCWGQVAVSDNALNRKLHEVRRVLSSLSENVSIKTIYGTGFLLEVNNMR